MQTTPAIRRAIIAACPRPFGTVPIYQAGIEAIQKYGAIVNNSSMGAFKAVPGFAAYDASKSGMIGLTKAAALEYAASGIRINVFCPGPTDGTKLMENLTRYHPEEREHINGMIPMRRLAQAEEMAKTVLWLCSDAASFMTGATISVDGGMGAA